MVHAGEVTVDFSFIDADKENMRMYVEKALALSHPGSIIVVDNVVIGGEVSNEESSNTDVIGARAMLHFIKNHPRLKSTVIQTVGIRGHDGFLYALVTH